LAGAIPSLEALDLDFRHLFASWFNRGFLVLRPINWESPAHILEKIIAYEAVHAIDSWEDLRRRLEPADRRCFAFFHPAMPDEPLIFVEVALTKGIAGSVQALLAEDRARPSPPRRPIPRSSTPSRTARRGWPASPSATR
jgi:malonyl-CoA decarboxylase